MSEDVTQTAIEAAERVISSYLDQVEPEDVDTLDLAEQVVHAIDRELAGQLVAAFNTLPTVEQLAAVVARQPMEISAPPSGFRPPRQVAASLYADKCAECTTGVSCNDAGRCLFEG